MTSQNNTLPTQIIHGLTLTKKCNMPIWSIPNLEDSHLLLAPVKALKEIELPEEKVFH